MPIIATLKDLDEKSLVKILKEPKNSLLKQYKRLFEFEDVNLEFREDALSEIAKKLLAKKLGLEVLRSILESILLKTMFSLTRYGKCRIGHSRQICRKRENLSQ